jgi:alkaline phosphatase
MYYRKFKSFEKNGLLVLFLSISTLIQAQPRTYTVSNAHSHNDYEQRIPFWMAYNAGFGSIEADIFLVDSVLFVAHDKTELRRKMKLDSSYLIPILKCIQKNHGHPFEDSGKKLQLLIDIKTDSIGTLNALIALLKKYPNLIRCKSLSWVITGNRPDESLYTGYPDFILFDGELHKNYSKEALSKISLMSDDFKKYSLWNGENNLPAENDSILRAAVVKSHHVNKPVRFWDAPDIPNTWRKLIFLQVDYINTDHIQSLAGFFKK